MRKRNLVSVIIPTYKNRGGLINAINSVLEQSYSNYEIIVVDDNNPDSQERKDTEALMTIYEDNKNIRYIKHECNKNGAAARNTGIAYSRGSFIAFLDDDDVFLPNKLSAQLDYLEKHSNYDAVYCLAQQSGKPILTEPLEGDLTKELLLLETKMFTPTLLFKSDVLKCINGFDESFKRHQDYDLLLRFFGSGSKIGCVPQILVEIGCNLGENIPSADKLYEIKSLFFEKFTPYIEKIESSIRGFRKRIYVLHYSKVAIAYLKDNNIPQFIKMTASLFVKSPLGLVKSYYQTVMSHIK